MPQGTSRNTNIEIESFGDYKSLFNSDTFKDSFTMKVYVEMEDSKVKVSDIVFLDFNDNFLNIHKHYLLARSEVKEFKSRWGLRPNYASYDLYETTAFAYLLMFMNNCTSVVDFEYEYIKVPTMAAIKELIISNQKSYPDRNKIKDIKFI